MTAPLQETPRWVCPVRFSAEPGTGVVLYHSPYLNQPAPIRWFRWPSTFRTFLDLWEELDSALFEDARVASKKVILKVDPRHDRDLAGFKLGGDATASTPVAQTWWLVLPTGLAAVVPGMSAKAVYGGFRHAMVEAFRVPYFTERYGFSRSGVMPSKWDAIYKSRDSLAQLLADGNERLAPLVLAVGRDLAALRKYFGRGLWKRLTACSASRLKAIGALISNLPVEPGDYQPVTMRDAARMSLDIPLVVLRAMDGYNVREYLQADVGWPGLCNLASTATEVAEIVRAMSGWQRHTGRPRTNYDREIFAIGQVVMDAIRMAHARAVPIPAGMDIRGYAALHGRQIALRRAEYGLLNYQAAPRPSTDFAWIPAMLVVGEADGQVYTATRLVNNDALVEEAQSMHHCVDGYAGTVADGVSQIWHIQGERRADRATVEFRRDGSVHSLPRRSEWAVKQCSAPCNEFPSAALRTFVDTTLLAAVRKEDLRKPQTDEGKT